MSLPIRLSALLLIGCAAACSPQKIEEAVDDGGVTLPTLPLPKNKDGAYQLIEVAGSHLDINPGQNDAITAVGRCADLITACYRSDAASLDDCVANAHACKTEQPWTEKTDCCPSTCSALYSTERGKGTAALDAFEKVYFLEPGCFPGVLDAVGGAP